MDSLYIDWKTGSTCLFWQAVWELSRICLLKDVTKLYKCCEAYAQCCGGKQQLITKASVMISDNPVSKQNGNTSIRIYVHDLKSASLNRPSNQSNQSIPRLEDPNLSPIDPWEPARLVSWFHWWNTKDAHPSTKNGGDGTDGSSCCFCNTMSWTL